MSFKMGNSFLGSLLTLTFLLSACSIISSPEASEKISLKNDLFQVDVLPGSFATDDCGINPSDFEIDEIVCVAFPLSSKIEEGKNWDAEYLTALDVNGWKWAGGEGNAYYLEKPKSRECSYSLFMMGWVQGSEEEVRNYFDTGELGNIKNQTYIFGIDDELKCGAERNVK